jgi:LCP family protein required for cell wall assembly
VSEGQRSDTTFIVHVSGDRTRVDVVSIPRDTLITIPNCTFEDGSKVPQDGLTKQKFNSAFGYASEGKGDTASGVACTIMAVEAMSQVPIDGAIVVDFAGFAQIIDAIGGVDIWLPCAVSSPDANNLSLPAGLNHLDGDTATSYARARTGKGLGTGSDLDRIRRQQALFMAVAGKVTSMNVLTNFGTLYSFAGSVADTVTITAPELGSIAQLAGFAYSLRGFSTSELSFNTIPIADAGDGANVVLVPAKDKVVWDALNNDTSVTDALNPPPPTSAATASASDGAPAETPAAVPDTSSPPALPSVMVPSPTDPNTIIPPGVVSAPADQCN